ncbi:ABC transporter permease [Streptomyces sp. NPDC001536]|uniref:ABC transporter permease n=1 Tax=Streptomyces sp. NPDC001536 TaxID=3364583 RepID=UPI0036AFED2B
MDNPLTVTSYLSTSDTGTTPPSVPVDSRPGVGLLRRPTIRALRYWLSVYRQTWQASLYVSVVNPLLYLGALGLGLGTLVDRTGNSPIDGTRYLDFVAPAVLALHAMVTTTGECSFPVYRVIREDSAYRAAVATPLRPRDLLHGHLVFVAMRLTVNAVLFLTVMSALGAVKSPLALLALPAAVLTGLAFAAPIEAWTLAVRDMNALNYIFRFAMTPLMLFSATFSPLSTMPEWLRAVAYATPLWHGVSLCRMLSLGDPRPVTAVANVAYLTVFGLIGVALARRGYERRLYV